MSWTLFFVLIFIAVRVFGVQKSLNFVGNLVGELTKLFSSSKMKLRPRIEDALNRRVLNTKELDEIRDYGKRNAETFGDYGSPLDLDIEASYRQRYGHEMDKSDVVQPSGRTTAEILSAKPDFGYRRVY